MQTRVLLILLLCGVCFSCHSPQQDKQESDKAIYQASRRTIVDSEYMLSVNLKVIYCDY